MESTCARCSKAVIEKQKKNGQGTYKVNPDGSYHTIPVNQADGTTKWYCSGSKAHEAWIKEHNGPSGFVESGGKVPDLSTSYKPQTNELEAVIETRQHNPQMNLARETVLDAFFEADQIVTKIYPNLSKTSGTYGQIRSKFTDQIIQAFKTVTLEQAIKDNKVN